MYDLPDLLQSIGLFIYFMSAVCASRYVGMIGVLIGVVIAMWIRTVMSLQDPTVPVGGKVVIVAVLFQNLGLFSLGTKYSSDAGLVPVCCAMLRLRRPSICHNTTTTRPI